MFSQARSFCVLQHIKFGKKTMAKLKIVAGNQISMNCNCDHDLVRTTPKAISRQVFVSSNNIARLSDVWVTLNKRTPNIRQKKVLRPPDVRPNRQHYNNNNVFLNWSKMIKIWLRWLKSDCNGSFVAYRIPLEKEKDRRYLYKPYTCIPYKHSQTFIRHL